MTRASGPPIYDADSHIMELPDFLRTSPIHRLKTSYPKLAIVRRLSVMRKSPVILEQGGKHSEAHVSEQIALGDELIAKSKEIQALGAFTRADRTTALDMLGFKKQLVFATHSVAFPFHPSSKKDPVLRYGAARAHNRHMAHFCEEDDRFLGVGVIPLDDPTRAISELEAALDLGMKAIWVPHRAPLDHSPGHVDLEPFWELWHRLALPSSSTLGAHRSSLAKRGVITEERKSATGWVVARMFAPKTQP